MTKDEALRLALEALEKIAYVTAMDYEYQRWAREDITAIKAALEAKDEPMHPEIKKLYEDYFDKCFRESSSLDKCFRDSFSPQRTWVGLTNEEMLMLEETTTCTKDESWLRNLTRAIEAKLRSKNNA